MRRPRPRGASGLTETQEPGPGPWPPSLLPSLSLQPILWRPRALTHRHQRLVVFPHHVSVEFPLPLLQEPPLLFREPHGQVLEADGHLWAQSPGGLAASMPTRPTQTVPSLRELHGSPGRHWGQAVQRQDLAWGSAAISWVPKDCHQQHLRNKVTTGVTRKDETTFLSTQPALFAVMSEDLELQHYGTERRTSSY